MLPKYEHFKFSVGQFVVSSFCAVNPKRRNEALTYQIIERMYQECPGGVQLHYLCRSSEVFNREQLVRYNEIELMALPDAEGLPSAEERKAW